MATITNADPTRWYPVSPRGSSHTLGREGYDGRGCQARTGTWDQQA